MSVGIATIADLMVMIRFVADHRGRHCHSIVGQGPGIQLLPTRLLALHVPRQLREKPDAT